MLAAIPQQQQRQPHRRHHTHLPHEAVSSEDVAVASYCSAVAYEAVQIVDNGNVECIASASYAPATSSCHTEPQRLNWADIYSDDDEVASADDGAPGPARCVPAVTRERGGRSGAVATSRGATAPRRSRGGRNSNHSSTASSNRSPRIWRSGGCSESNTLAAAGSRSWRSAGSTTDSSVTPISTPGYPNSPEGLASSVLAENTPEQTSVDNVTPPSFLSSQLFEASDLSSPLQRPVSAVDDDDDVDCVAEGEDGESSKVDHAVSFVGLWSAWFDPPKAPGSRGGISFDTYMEQLYEMGTIFDSRDFWGIHEQIDWENVPSGSMISFSRKGSKPCWEDPLNCNGARLVVRGFPRHSSERLFTTVCLALLLGHFPNSQSLTCASLQVKDSRRGGNAVHIWSQDLDVEQFRALEEHVLCLCKNGGGGVDSPRQNGATKGSRTVRGSPTQPLRFEYCANSEAIERNVCRLDAGSRGGGLRRCGSSLQASTAALAANCDVVAQLYSAGKGSKRGGGKGCTSKKGRSRGGRSGNGGKKLDWADVLLQEISSSPSMSSTTASLSPSKSCTTLSSFNSCDSGTLDSAASVGAQWSAASPSKRKSRKR